jgi:hypothetical protein
MLGADVSNRAWGIAARDATAAHAGEAGSTARKAGDRGRRLERCREWLGAHGIRLGSDACSQWRRRGGCRGRSRRRRIRRRRHCSCRRRARGRRTCGHRLLGSSERSSHCNDHASQEQNRSAHPNPFAIPAPAIAPRPPHAARHTSRCLPIHTLETKLHPSGSGTSGILVACLYPDALASPSRAAPNTRRRRRRARRAVRACTNS